MFQVYCARLSVTWASIKAPTEGNHVNLIKELLISRDRCHLARIMNSRLLANAKILIPNSFGAGKKLSTVFVSQA